MGELKQTGALAVVAIVLAMGTAHAQPGAQAEVAYQEGRRLYDLQEWDQAIANFKEAYKLEPEPRSLFNIAQAYRLQGDCVQAASFYKTFKRNYPEERNVDQFIVEMDACAKTQAARRAPVTPAPPTTKPPRMGAATHVASVAPEPMPSGTPTTAPAAGGAAGKGLRIAGLAVAGAGVVNIGLGVVFGFQASAAAREAEDVMPGDLWDPEIQARGLRSQRKARIGLLAGGAMMVTGTVLYLLGNKTANEHQRVTVTPTSDGAAVVWTGGF